MTKTTFQANIGIFFLFIIMLAAFVFPLLLDI